MPDKNNQYEDYIRCANCGNTIGKREKNKIIIRHKGRIIVVTENGKDGCEVEIRCEKTGCLHTNKIVFPKP
jgi:hypothetical protein